MEVPKVQYAFTDDDVRIAYQDFGDGPPVIVSGFVFSHLEALWWSDLVTRVFERMAANLRVLLFDHRGSGMSDGFVDPPSLDDRTLDIKAVMAGAGLEAASIHGHDIGGQVAVGFAARFPDLVERLSLLNSRVALSAGPMADALNPGHDEGESALYGTADARIDQADARGADHTLEDGSLYFSPSAAKYPDYLDPDQTLAYERAVGSRDVWKRQIESFRDISILDVAPSVSAPTLITHAIGHRQFHIGHGRLLAELIPNSTLIEYEGIDQEFWLADNWREIIDYHVAFITDSTVEAPVERHFAVVLFTDIVDSTSASMATGDREWRSYLDAHDRISERVVTGRGGKLVKNTGDGLLATFSSPSQALDAATALRSDLADSGIRIRAGLHAGEVEIRGDDISGAVVNLAARVEQSAADGDICVTKSLRDMVLGTKHQFEPTGEHSFKGFDGVFHIQRLIPD